MPIKSKQTRVISSLKDIIMQAILLLIVVFPVAARDCPIWTVQINNTSSQCFCGSSLDGTVHCSLSPYQISVASCFCMTYNDQIGQVTVGRCLRTCSFSSSCKHNYHLIHSNQSRTLNDEICGNLNRMGQLCGNCVAGHAPPVLSYSFECVQCPKEKLVTNIFKYILLAFFPTTVVYLIVIIFKISITSHRMVAFVFTCQLLTAPYIVKASAERLQQNYLTKLMIEYLSFWNMDFLRGIHGQFCLHPSLNTMQVIALDYVVAVYPMFLIAATYIAVVLYDRCPLVVAAWRPMQKVLTCIRKEWNIRGSLVQAFATFLVLSYVKILNVSMELLNPEQLHEVRYGTELYYLYSAGTVTYFGQNHKPYGVLALLMLLIFIITPTLFLALYPMGCFRRCIGINNSVVVSTFMDAVSGCYRTQRTDCRPFAAVYFIARILQLLTFAATKDGSIMVMSGYYLIFLGITVLLMEPYANRIQNKLDALLLLNAATLFLLEPTRIYLQGYNTASFHRSKLDKLFVAFTSTCFAVQIMYGVIMVVAKLLPLKFWKWLRKRRLKNRTDENAPLIT